MPSNRPARRGCATGIVVGYDAAHVVAAPVGRSSITVHLDGGLKHSGAFLPTYPLTGQDDLAVVSLKAMLGPIRSTTNGCDPNISLTVEVHFFDNHLVSGSMKMVVSSANEGRATLTKQNPSVRTMADLAIKTNWPML